MSENSPTVLLARLEHHRLLTERQALEVAARPDSADAGRFADDLVQRGWITAFQAVHLLSDDLSKLELGGYRLLEPIGSGGMGEVYLARQIKLDRLVALKLIHPHFATDKNIVARFRREALAVARMAHPNIITLFDADEVNGTHFLAMEYIRGEDLSQLVGRHGPLPAAAACDYIRQAALGLQHAFEAKLIHRDIKPSNLLVALNAGQGPLSPVGDYGLVKVLDLGLARLSEDPGTTQLSRGRGVLGTPDFMSPEQARDSSRVDVRSDLYSLGCTLYFLLTGRAPFPNGSGVEKILCHQLERAKPVTQYRTDVPTNVLDVVNRLMRKEQRERYQLPLEVVAALAPAAGRGIGPDRPTPLPPPRQMPQRPAVAFAPPASPPHAPTVKVAPLPMPSVWGMFEPSTGKPIAAPRPATLIDEAPFEEEKPRVVVRAVSPLPLPGRGSSFCVPAALLVLLEGHTAPVSAMAFSPRGRMLATGGLDNCIRLWRINGDKTCQVTAFEDPRLGEVRAIAFTPVGDLLVASSGVGGRVWHWRWQDERERDMVALEQSFGASVLTISPDGKQIAAAGGDQVGTWTEAGGTFKSRGNLPPRGGEITALTYSADGRLLLAGDVNGQVLTWREKRTGFRAVADFSAHNGAITCLALAPDHQRLATAGSDNAVRLWTTRDEIRATAQLGAALRGTVRRLQFGMAGSDFVTATDFGQVARWRANDAAQIIEWRVAQPVSTSIAIADHGEFAAFGRTDGGVQLYLLPPEPVSPGVLRASAQGLSRIPI